MEPKIAALLAATAALGNDFVTNATEAFIMLVYHQVVAMIGKASFKAPSDEQKSVLFMLVKEKMSVIGHVKQSNRNSPPHHLQTIMDSFGLFNWPLYSNENELTDMIEEYHS